METNIKKKSTFSAISINRITAERFREYSKSVSKSHSDTIDTMIDFFEKAKITPKSEVIISFIKFQNYMTRRFDYIEELLRGMESNYLKPTHEMLKSLFDGVKPKKKKQQPLLMDRDSIKMTRAEWFRNEAIVSFDEHHNVLKSKSEENRKFREVLRKITQVEPTFGKPYFKIEIDATELNVLKEEFLGRSTN